MRFIITFVLIFYKGWQQTKRVLWGVILQKNESSGEGRKNVLTRLKLFKIWNLREITLGELSDNKVFVVNYSASRHAAHAYADWSLPHTRHLLAADCINNPAGVSLSTSHLLWASVIRTVRSDSHLIVISDSHWLSYQIINTRPIAVFFYVLSVLGTIKQTSQVLTKR